MNIHLWTILGIVAIAGLIIFYKKGIAWGGLILGAIIGCTISIINMINSGTFVLAPVRTGAIIGALIGLVAAVIIRIRNKEKHKAKSTH